MRRASYRLRPGVSSKGVSKMRVFCREHERGFFAPRQNPIKCDNRGHILGELNFAGDKRSEIDLSWQYCCNCEHFCPISPDGDSLKRCPVCARGTSQLYVCDRCFTISFESNPPINTKNFTLTAEGVPRPACPGCLQASTGEVREHECDDLGRSFTTALTTCPICRERLDIGPSFPNLVSQFLRKTKAANKTNVTFDYDTGLFVEIEDGEFVIVPDGSEPNRVMIVPRLAQFSDPRQFYEFYQDYYHHRAEIRVGEVFIHEPALAERADGGWTFKSQGMLEVVDDHPQRRTRKVRINEAPLHQNAPVVAIPSAKPAEPAITPPGAAASLPPRTKQPAITPPSAAERASLPPRATERAISPPSAAERASLPPRATEHIISPPSAAERASLPPRTTEPPPPGDIDTEAPPSVAAAKAEQSAGVCQHCGSAIEEKYAFCWNCGKPMGHATPSETKRPKNPSRRLIIDMDDVPNVQPFEEGPSFRRQTSMKRGNGSVPKLLLVMLVGSTALVSGMAGMWWLKRAPQVTTAAVAAQTAASTSQSAQEYVPTVAVSNSPAETPVPTNIRSTSADDELRAFDQRRTKGTAAERRNVMRDITRLEREFPNDYRFPYERAKLSASDAKSRDVAFQALFIAAQRAIKAGKAGEMLHALEADRSRDFRNLVRSHVEWAQIVQSLKNRDATLLAANGHSA